MYKYLEVTHVTMVTKTIEEMARENFEVTETMDIENGRKRVFFKFYFPYGDDREDEMMETSCAFWKGATRQDVAYNLRNRWKREYKDFLRKNIENQPIAMGAEPVEVDDSTDISKMVGKRGAYSG